MAIVYIHRKNTDKEPFYVGIGKSVKRAYQTENRRSEFWKRVASKYSYTVEIHKEGISWKEACKIEKDLIKLYGRIDLGTGTLVNLTDGGDGSENRVVREETRNKLRNLKNGFFGKTHTEEFKNKMKNLRAGKSPVHKNKVRVFNGTLYKYINKEDLESHIKLGWILKGKSHTSHKGKSIKCPESNTIFNSQKEAANYYKVSDATISMWVKKGRLIST